MIVIRLSASLNLLTYPNLVERLFEEDYLNSRSILTLTIENVDILNEYICSLLSRVVDEYFSLDSINGIDDANESFKNYFRHLRNL